MVLYDPQYHQKRAAVLAQRKRDEEDALMRKPTRPTPPTAHDARRPTFALPPQALLSTPSRTTTIHCVKAGRTQPADAPPRTDTKPNTAWRPKKERISHPVQARNSPASSDDDAGRLALEKVQSLTAHIAALEASLTAAQDAVAFARWQQLKTMHAAHQVHIMNVQTSCSTTHAGDAEAARQQELKHSTRRQLVHDVHSANAMSTVQSDKMLDALCRGQREHDAEHQQLRIAHCDELQAAHELSAMTLEDVNAQHAKQLGALTAKHKAAQDDAAARHSLEMKSLRTMFQAVSIARDAAAKAAHQRKRRALEALHARAIATLEADLAQVHRASANVVRRIFLKHDQVVIDMQSSHTMQLETAAVQLLQAQDECMHWRLALHRTVMKEAATVASIWICVRDEMRRRLDAAEEASAQREADMAIQHALEVQRLQDELDHADAAHTADLALHAEAVEAMDDLYQSTVAGHEATTSYLEWQLQTIASSPSCRTPTCSTLP